MPVAAIDDDFVKSEIVGRVEAIRELALGHFEVRIALSAATVGGDAGQLINMLFGNSSIHDDVVLYDVELPSDLVLGQPATDGLNDLPTARNRQALLLMALSLQEQRCFCQDYSIAADRTIVPGTPSYRCQ